MDRRKKIINLSITAIIVLAIILGFYLCLVLRKDNSLSNKKIKIGLLIAQTGFGSDFGQSEKAVIPLLQEMYGDKVQFILEDSKSDAAKGVVAARKLLDVDNVDMIYCDLTSVANAISPILKNSRKILMAAVYLENLTNDNQFAIRNIPNAKDESKLLFRFFSEKHRGGKILLVGSNDEFGRGAVSASKSLLNEFGLVLAGIDTIPEDLSLIASFAEKIVKSAPDGVYIGSMAASMGIFIKELRARGYKGIILTTDAFSYDYILNAAGKSAQSVVYVDFPQTDEFHLITKKLKGKNVTPASILMYDGIRMYLDRIHLETYSRSDMNIKDLVCQITGVYGNTKLVKQEMKYPLVLVNADR